MKNIHIGDEWVEVPIGYVYAESIYTDGTMVTFHSMPEGPSKEKARQLVLNKRVEVHQKYISGEIVIPEPTTQEAGWFTKSINRLTS